MKRRDLLKGMFAVAAIAVVPASAKRKASELTPYKNAQGACPHDEVMIVRHCRATICLHCQKRWDDYESYLAECLAYRAAMTINSMLATWQPNTAYNRGDLVLWHDGSIKECALAGMSGVASPLRLSTECWQDF